VAVEEYSSSDSRIRIEFLMGLPRPGENGSRRHCQFRAGRWIPFSEGVVGNEGITVVVS